MKSIDKCPRAVLQNGHYPEITYIVDFILLNYSDLWKNRFSIKNPFQEKKWNLSTNDEGVNSPGPKLPGGNPPTPTKLKNQFPNHFLFIVNSTILYKNKNPFQEKKWNLSTNLPGSVLQNGHYLVVSIILYINIVIYGKK